MCLSKSGVSKALTACSSPEGWLLASKTTLRPLLSGDSKPAITASVLALVNVISLRLGLTRSRWSGSHQFSRRDA